jgi:integrase/recombinase XerC
MKNQVKRILPLPRKQSPLAQTNQPTLAAAIESFLATCRARNLSPNTCEYYTYRLRAFRTYLEADTPPDAITADVIRDFLSFELERNSPTTAQHSYCALRAFFAYLESEGFVSDNPMTRVAKPKRKQSVIPTLNQSQVEALLATCGRDFYGVRDRAIILTLIDCGLRVSELVTLKLDDVDLLRQTLLVLGKGNKERLVPFGNTVKQALASYIARRGDLETDVLFVGHLGEPMTRHAVRWMLRIRGKEAGITGVRLSPHTLRHTFAVSYLRAGGDTFSLQKILGHSSLDMSRRYAELADEDVFERHRMCSPADRLNVRKEGRRRLK